MFVVPEQKDHPVMRGVKDMHAMAGAYSAVPIEGSVILGKNQVLLALRSGYVPTNLLLARRGVFLHQHRVPLKTS